MMKCIYCKSERARRANAYDRRVPMYYCPDCNSNWWEDPNDKEKKEKR